MKNYRIFVEKYPDYQVEASTLLKDLNLNLGLKLSSLRLLNVYDLFGFSAELLEKSRYTVFGEVVTDCVSDECNLDGKKYLAVEYLPGQFDQRASSAVSCVRLIEPSADVRIKSSRLIIFDGKVSDDDMARIEKYFINAVECRKKDLSVLSDAENAEIKPVPVLEGFTEMADAEAFCREYGLAMNADDLREVIRYFKEEGRNPSETELRILDTYWSDHCRHTTFTTELTNVEIEDSFIKNDIKATLSNVYAIRAELGREQKSFCLMELATIGARYLKKTGVLDNMEVSEENNACSIYMDVDVDGKIEKWLLQFKNETHNHPTEIEPFGGASTCLGGAIRDPLSGRSYVYQAMRVTGAGDIWQKVSDTIPGKLPQRIISTKAAAGYSSYGNQIGLATTHVREIYHPDYVAKRLEVGAVVGAVRVADVRRESPAPGDVILMFGGRTGRDGIGGATGSSKEHNVKSIEECGSEVQKGNAPEERKIERLFRRPEVTRLIKKSNDFGAGGVSVAIGELADGLDIWLDRVPVKYNGLNATELAISESQERMSVVIAPQDKDEFMEYCRQENLEVTYVANVTDTARMRMYYNGKLIVDLSRKFIDSAGAKHYATVKVGTVAEKDVFHREVAGSDLTEKIKNNLLDDNVQTQKGLAEMFDSTVGASTVLMPFGGKTQNTETQVSVQKIPVGNGYTDTASIMAFGFNPFLTSWSPYHGASYAVVEAVTKVVAAGARYDKMRFSYQEYFEKMHSELSWGKPFAALLGTIKMQVELGLPSIGGKDSMSGTFQNINVPPTLIAFGITTVDAKKVISPEFKAAGHNIYLVRHTPLKNGMPDTEQLKKNFTYVSDNIENGNIVSAWSVGFGGVAEAVCKMSFGNVVGAKIEMENDKLFDYSYGSIVVESANELTFANAEKIGETIIGNRLIFNYSVNNIEDLQNLNISRYSQVYPDRGLQGGATIKGECNRKCGQYAGAPVNEVIAYLPAFAGTNCDYDTAKAFERAGAKVTTSVFCDLTADDIFASIAEMKKRIDECHILAISGGFSLGDEPDGSGKFIANILNNKEIAESINALIDRGGLILGICNGFQALVKSGLLPYGRLGMVTKESPTLFRNDINRHISQIVTTRIATTASPWLSSFRVGETHSIAVSHGEGKFTVSEEFAKELFANGQVAFQYVDDKGNATMDAPFNPNGSSYGIEGIISRDGHILGKMGHTERYEENLFKNIHGNKVQSIFKNAVNYFKKI